LGRPKACAGALTIKTLRALRYSAGPVVRRVCHDLKVGLRLDPPKTLPSRHPIAAMTLRAELDAYCLAQCVQAGCRHEAPARVCSAGQRGGLWVAATDDAEYTGRFLIGADGATSAVRKSLGLEQAVAYGLAVEAPVACDLAARVDMQFDFAAAPGGYGWLFPKHDHVNVGLFTRRATLPRAARRLHDYARARLGLPLTGPCRGGRVTFLRGALPHRPRSGAFLVGDAAGLVDPLLGEGIYNAVRSGQLAAAAILDMTRGRPDSYRPRMKVITRDLASCAAGADRFENDADRAFRHLTNPLVRYCLVKGFALGYTFRQTQRRFWRMPFGRPPAVLD
jgi:flavin-dependent dehydrogenase